MQKMLESWSLAQKRRLHLGLKQHGCSDIELLQEAVPEKSLGEIREAVQFYQNLGVQKTLSANRKSPLHQWVEIVKNINLVEKDNIDDIIPRVLKYIALFEKRPSVQSDINISNCYRILSDLSRGRPSKEDNLKDHKFVYKCLSKMAGVLRKESMENEQKFLQGLKDVQSLKQVTTYSRTNNRTMTKSKLLNPLSVPSELLARPQLENGVVFYEDEV